MAVLSNADVQTIVGAMLGVLKTGGKDLLAYAETEAANFTQSIETITELRLTGQISEQGAKDQLQLQKDASQAVLTAQAGIAAILAAQAINAGLGAVAGIVNKAIGFPLLPTV
jgi:hypothetical protein